MRSRGRLPISRRRLFVELLEDRTNPGGLADPFAGVSFAIADTPADRVNVVTAGATESPIVFARLLAAPFAADVRHIGFGIYNVTLTAGAEVTDAVSYYSSQPGVTAAEPDYTIRVEQTPNDTQYSQLYGMTRISAPLAWDTTTGSGNFVVAVIDSGVDYNHPDLAANMWRNPADAIDGVDNDGNGLIDDHYGAEFVGTNSGNPFDDNGHGTHVAGTIGAVGNNALGIAGVNWNVKIMALKFLSASGSGSTSDAVEALNYAVAHGVKVSNNSWGGGGFSSALFNAIQAAQNAGHIFVAAAGNSNVNIDTSPHYPSSYNLANVVAVASTTSTDAKSSFSNFGVNTVDIAAPGSSIRSTTPNNTYSNFSGTSMASPHVAGAIALYWDANPTATASQVISKLTSSADAVAGLNSFVPGGRRLNVARMFEGVSPPPPPADTTGARVTAAAFSGTSSSNFTRVRLTFSEAIVPSSFGINDVVSFTGPGGVSIPVTGVAVVNAPTNTQFDVTFATQTAAGTYSMVIGPNILDAANNPMNQNNTAPNGEVPGDQFTATQALNPTTTQTFDVGGLPLPIRDFQYTRATISIDQDILISDVNARFSATHTWDGDLVVRLIGPGGQASTLVNRRGGSANHFTNTTLDDEASTPIANGSAPFTATYRPETTLTTFDGRNARGRWTLEVYDAASRDFGDLTAFRLVITGTNGGLSVSVLGECEGMPFTEPVPTTPAVPAETISEVIQPAAPPAALFLAPGGEAESAAPVEPAPTPVRAAAPPAQGNGETVVFARANPPVALPPESRGETQPAPEPESVPDFFS